MRRLRYSVAASLDGFIAGPQGEYDWIKPDPGFDFAAMFREFDTMLMGRRTWEVTGQRGNTPGLMGLKGVVVSTTLDPRREQDVTVIGGEVSDAVAAMKREAGKDIWLSGGAMLFRSLLDANLVDTVELAVMPILLGGGVRVIPEGRRCALRLVSSEAFPNGMLWVKYAAGAG